MQYTKTPCNVDALTKEISDSEITVQPTSITLFGSDLTINFENQLSEGDETILNAVVTAHTGDPLPNYIINSLTLNEAQLAQLAADDAARLFANRLTAYLKVLNVSSGLTLSQSLWVHNRLRALEITINGTMATNLPPMAPLLGQTITIDAMNLVISGDIETSYFVFATATPDDMSEDFHALTPDLLGFLRNQIGVYLGWETPT